MCHFALSIAGMIKNTRTPFNIDFGIGDVIVPKSEKRKTPTQLDGFIQPEISTYSLESTIAEKFDAIISRFEFTSCTNQLGELFRPDQVTDHFRRLLDQYGLRRIRFRKNEFEIL